MRKIQWSLALLAIPALALTACGSAGEGSGSNNGAPTSGGEQVTLTYWDFIDPSQDTIRSKMLKANLEAFEAANPDIKIQLEVVSFGDMLSRLPQAAAAGQVPDVIKMYSPLLPQLAEAGVYQTLPSGVDSVTDWLLPIDGLSDAAGNQVAVPYEFRTCSLVYNTEYLNKAGLKVPETWDETVEVAAALSQQGVTGFGTGFSKEDNASMIAELFDCMMMQVGQDLVDANGTPAFATSTAAPFGDFLTGLRDADALSQSVVADQYSVVTDGLSNGTVGMAVMGTHRIITVQSVNPAVDWAPIPGVTAGDHKTATFGWTLGVGKSSTHSEQAWRFIEYMTGPEAQARMAEGGEVPVRAATYEEPFFSTPEAATVLAIRDYLDEWATPRAYPSSYLTISLALAEAAQRMYLEGTTGAEMLQQAQEIASK